MDKPHDPAKLETELPLVSFGDFSRAVPERWRKAPLYVQDQITGITKAVRLVLMRDDLGNRVVVVCSEYAKLKRAEAPLKHT